MYRYLTLNDGTEVVHSDVLSDGRVKVFFERPDEQDGFHDATCFLPDYTWENVSGFSAKDMQRNEQLLKEVAHIIIELAHEGGFNAPQIVRVGTHLVCFCTDEGHPSEPVHAHVSQGVPTKGTTKIWPASTGRIARWPAAFHYENRRGTAS